MAKTDGDTPLNDALEEANGILENALPVFNGKSTLGVTFALLKAVTSSYDQAREAGDRTVLVILEDFMSYMLPLLAKEIRNDKEIH